jgi:hypothetical protein
VLLNCNNESLALISGHHKFCTDYHNIVLIILITRKGNHRLESGATSVFDDKLSQGMD